MAAIKTVFNEVYSAILEFIGIKPQDIVDSCNDYILDVDTVRSWRSRGTPSVSNFDVLLDVIENILCEKEYTVIRCGKQQSELKEILMPIWKKYNVPVVQWKEDKTIIENLIEIISVAYETSKSKNVNIQKNNVESVSRVVAFDLDGTLIKGFRYSWTIVFKAIGSTGKEAVKFKEDFEFGRITYPDWCRSDCDILRAGGLTFEKVQRAVKESGASLTKNLLPAIEKLKANGCKVAIISGGADSVLYSLLPNADEIFDEIFINKLVYDKETGILEKIIPTLYDWDRYGNGVEGKQAGLIRLCERYGVEPKDSVFVGDDYNDVGAMAIAGMKIFYYSYSQYDPSRGLSKRPNIRKIPDDAIHEPGNDLMRVANRILNWQFGDIDYTD